MKKGKLKQGGHLLAGLLILVHGFAAFEEKDFKAAAGYLGVAILALIVAGLHKFINRNFRQADVAFFFLEAATLLFSAWEYREENRIVLSYFIAAAGIGYLLWAFFSLILKDEHERRHSETHRNRKRLRSTSSRTHDK